MFPDEPPPYSAYAPVAVRRGRLAAHRKSALPGDATAEIARLASQLAGVAATVPWGRIQGDTWDEATDFIYRMRSPARVSERARLEAYRRGVDAGALMRYALRRWYCFMGARLAELLFLQHAGVVAGPPRERLYDFSIDGVRFDLKTTEVPRQFASAIDEIAARPERLIAWLYAHQSQERRHHNANRMFLVLCDAANPAEAWRLRGDVNALREAIDRFMARRRFAELSLPDRDGIPRRVVSAAIAIVPAGGPRQLSLALPSASSHQPAPHRPPPVEPRTLPLFPD